MTFDSKCGVFKNNEDRKVKQKSYITISFATVLLYPKERIQMQVAARCAI